MIKNIYILHTTEGTLFEKNFGEKNICFRLFSNFLAEVSDKKREIGYVHFNDFMICYLTHKPILIAVIFSKTSELCSKDFLQALYDRFVRKYREYLSFDINQRQIFDDFEKDVIELVKKMRVSVPLQII
ncbi:MAG: hypothetical protein ACTSW1_02615 [Candidatus Hodarchaeales archaeon]